MTAAEIHLSRSRHVQQPVQQLTPSTCAPKCHRVSGLFPSRTLVGAGAIALRSAVTVHTSGALAKLPAGFQLLSGCPRRRSESADGYRRRGSRRKGFFWPAWPQDCPERRSQFSRSNPAAPPAQQQLRQIRGRWKNRRRRWWRTQGGRTRLNTCRSTRQFECAKTRDNYLRKQED